MIPAKLGAGEAIERSRSASCRSMVLQSDRPDEMAARPSATLRSSTWVRSTRMASLGAVSRITATNLSTTVWMRGRAMSVHASAEPMIGPTRPARSRTTSTGAALAALAINVPSKITVQRGRCIMRRKTSNLWALPGFSSDIVNLQDIRVERPGAARASVAIERTGAAVARIVRASQALNAGWRKEGSAVRKARAARRRCPPMAPRPAQS